MVTWLCVDAGWVPPTPIVWRSSLAGISPGSRQSHTSEVNDEPIRLGNLKKLLGWAALATSLDFRWDLR